MIPLMLAASIAAAPPSAGHRPVDVYCSTGDHLWVAEREPVDSPAAIGAMMEWMSATYGVRRMYWRGGGSEIWDRHYKVGADRPVQYDWAVNWKRELFREENINAAAVRAAHARGMEIYLYTGLFEHGVQPDVGIIAPYLIEDRLRIRHPEWCMLDRWGERRCPGPLSLAYPEVRERLVERMVDSVRRFGWDGVTFYTYVENVGLRYPDEFGFNEPVIARFQQRYPDTDPRGDLTTQQREHWRRCRGTFVTQYLRELHEALAAEGADLMLILDSATPDRPQPWWGKPAPGTGPIHLDWEGWIEEGIVDGIWVQLGGMDAQCATLDRVLEAADGREIDVVVRTPTPRHERWESYVQAGVTPVAVITAPRNGIERYTLQETSRASLDSADWKLRAQALADVATGELKPAREEVGALADDEHLLVRRRAVEALATFDDPQAAALIEDALEDPEASVRIAAAAALAECHRQESMAAILEALTRDGSFQFKNACVDALAGIGSAALAQLVEAADGGCEAVREVSVRAIYRVGREAHSGRAFDRLLATAGQSSEAPPIRYHALTGAVGLRLRVEPEQQLKLAQECTRLLETGQPPMVQHRAAWGLGHLQPLLDDGLQAEALDALTDAFRRYGDACERPDAAYGWRPIGNAILRYGEAGRAVLEQMRLAPADRWLAWNAYQTVHVPQTSGTMDLIDEAEAVRVHEEYAPQFPGWRAW